MYIPPVQTIRNIGEILRYEMPRETAEMLLQIRTLEAMRYELNVDICDWGRMLAEKRAQMLHPKDKELTELDRKTMLHASVAVIERDFDFLCNLQPLVEDRLGFLRMFLQIKG